MGAVHEEAEEDLLDPDFAVRPTWRAALLTRLAPTPGAAGTEAVTGRLDW